MKKNTAGSLDFKKFQVAQIQNPDTIFGGDDDITINATVPVIIPISPRKPKATTKKKVN